MSLRSYPQGCGCVVRVFDAGASVHWCIFHETTFDTLLELHRAEQKAADLTAALARVTTRSAMLDRALAEVQR